MNEIRSLKLAKSILSGVVYEDAHKRARNLLSKLTSLQVATKEIDVSGIKDMLVAVRYLQEQGSIESSKAFLFSEDVADLKTSVRFVLDGFDAASKKLTSLLEALQTITEAKKK